MQNIWMFHTGHLNLREFHRLRGSLTQARFNRSLRPACTDFLERLLSFRSVHERLDIKQQLIRKFLREVLLKAGADLLAHQLCEVSSFERILDVANKHSARGQRHAENLPFPRRLLLFLCEARVAWPRKRTLFLLSFTHIGPLRVVAKEPGL